MNTADFIQIRWLAFYGATVALRVDNFTANEAREPNEDELRCIIRRSVELTNRITDVEKSTQGQVL